MKQNVGGIDRGIRIVAGLVILSLYFVLDENTRLWALIGLVPLLTGLIGWCPAYLPFGIRTCKMRRD
ncbi:MAG: YgaP family membrane protein [Burkholderiaceae bacterium]